MAKRSAKHQERSKLAKKLKKEGKLPRKPATNIKFKLKKYPKTNLHLVFDLDKTLWYMQGSDSDFTLFPRPEAFDFIKFCSKIAKKITLITAADLVPTLEKLKRFGQLPPFTLLTANDLLRVPGQNFKHDMKYREGLGVIKIVPGFDPSTTIIIDDIPEFYMVPHRSNVIKIKPYRGCKDDEALVYLSKFLCKFGRKHKESIPELIEQLVADAPHYFGACHKIPPYNVVEDNNGVWQALNNL